jgi:uncharacterized protein YqgC (DUF456 family)
MLQVLLYFIVILLFLAGLGIALVNLPGVWLVYLGVVVYSLSTGLEQIGLAQLIVLLFVAVAVSLIDNLVVPLGARKYGASTWGMVGAIAGGLFGALSAGPIGMFVGPLLGATLFEIAFSHKNYEKAFRAGIGATIGFFISVVLKFGVTVWIVFWTLGKMF